MSRPSPVERAIPQSPLSLVIDALHGTSEATSETTSEGTSGEIEATDALSQRSSIAPSGARQSNEASASIVRSGRYKRLMTLQEGTFGKVVLAADARTQCKVALKTFKQVDHDGGLPFDFLRETSALRCDGTHGHSPAS